MTDRIIQLLTCIGTVGGISLLFFLISRINTKRSQRYKQIWMPVFALVYAVAATVFFTKISALILKLLYLLPTMLASTVFAGIGAKISALLSSLNLEYWVAFIANCAILLAFIIVKPIVLAPLCAIGAKSRSVCELFYVCDEEDFSWYLKTNLSQCRIFAKTLYIASALIAASLMYVSKFFYEDEVLSAFFSPIFTAIVTGELYFALNGLSKEEEKGTLDGEDDNARTVANSSSLRQALRKLFGDKLAAEDTTFTFDMAENGTKDAMLDDWENSEDRNSEAYATFMRALTRNGMQLDANYLLSGHDLLQGKNILFNNPFYYDLLPYAFYAMNRTLVRCKKVLIILGRHGAEEEIAEWCNAGLESITNVPELWHIGVLGQCEDVPEVGILRMANVCDLELHEQYADFLSQVEFVVLIEPSNLIPTAQIGLHSIVRHCKKENITYCSTDKNCDGLVDALSHILMTQITEVSATNHHSGSCSYMCWEVDQEMLQHRLFPNVSHYLGIGTELSAAALKNQVSCTYWYGGNAFPVTDMHWIDKQYYYDLLSYASLPVNQSMMNQSFVFSPNMYEAGVQDHCYITVEDEAFNMFEAKRNFATRATQQSFINIISPEYMLRDYMASNDALFNADAKAIPYIVADYARTKRNVALRLSLRMCVETVCEADLVQELTLVGKSTDDPVASLWEEICRCYQPIGHVALDEQKRPLLQCSMKGVEYVFSQDIIQGKKCYSVGKGIVETVYSIENQIFRALLLNDLHCAGYIAEDEMGQQQYIGSELSGHVFQKHLPGQFFTIHGRYYEMLSMTSDGKVLLRRAAEHINGRPYYRQIRHYTIHRLEESDRMGARKEIAGLCIDHCLADIQVKTDAYWRMGRYNDFKTARKVTLSGIDDRRYCCKNILRLDFSGVPGFTREIRTTMALLMNETFRTLFAENQCYISAVVSGEFQSPMTNSLSGSEEYTPDDNCIYIIEDSQLDIGLLVAVERNLDRILMIICDYLDWHFEALDKSLHPEPAPTPAPAESEAAIEEQPKQPEQPDKKVRFIDRIKEFIRKIFGKFKKKPVADTPESEESVPGDCEEDASPLPEEEIASAAEENVDIVSEEEPTAESDVPQAPMDSTADDVDAEAEDAATGDVAAADDPEETQPVLMSVGITRLYSGDEDAATVQPEPEEASDADVKDELEFEPEQILKPGVSTERAPYHERYYLLYGDDTVPEGLALEETLEFLKGYGYDNSTLKQARKGRDIAEMIENTFKPNVAGVHYCDFCGCELLGTEYDILSDGRERCPNCTRTAIKTAEEFERIYKDVVRNLDVFYGVRLQAPIQIQMVNAKKLHHKLGKSFVPTGKSDGRILGVAIKDKKGHYSILMENGAPRLASIMTMVHEMTHIWQYLNWDKNEILKKYGKARELEIYEGMAKWSEIQYAYLIGETATAKREEIITRMREDEYGIGFIKYAGRYPLTYKTQLEGETPFMHKDAPL